MPDLVLTENGNLKMQDGKAVMKGDDGKEFTYDIIAGYAELKDTRSEAGSWRKKLRDSEEKLKAFDGIEDAEAARQAVKTVDSLDETHKADMATLRQTVSDGYDAKLTKKDTEISDLRGRLFKHNVTDRFHTSEIAKKLVYTPQDAAIIFGSNFEVNDDGELVGKLNGNMIHSQEKPGTPAGFDEALTVMIEARPDKDNILKGSGMQGAGSPPGRQGVGQGMQGQDTRKGSDLIREGIAKGGFTKPLSED